MRQRSEGRDRRLLLALYTFSFRSVRTEINALAVVEAAIAACYDGWSVARMPKCRPDVFCCYDDV